MDTVRCGRLRKFGEETRFGLQNGQGPCRRPSHPVPKGKGLLCPRGWSQACPGGSQAMEPLSPRHRGMRSAAQRGEKEKNKTPNPSVLKVFQTYSSVTTWSPSRCLCLSRVFLAEHPKSHPWGGPGLEGGGCPSLLGLAGGRSSPDVPARAPLCAQPPPMAAATTLQGTARRRA